MRKIQVAMTTLMLAIVMGISSLFGCGLVTVNSSRDLAQVVATVQITSDAPVETIYKRDVVNAYINNYNSLTGESTEEVLDSLVSNLVNNKVIVQYAKLYFAKANNIQTDKWEITQYLSDPAKLNAEYNTYKAMDSFIESFEEHNHDGEKKQDTYSESVRAVPTGATVDADVSDYDKRDFIKDFSVEERMTLFVKAINSLKENEMLGNKYANNDITTTQYFEKTKIAYYEEELVKNLQKDITSKARGEITYADVQAEYERIYNSQKDLTRDGYNALFDTYSASAPILYGRDGYGMVYHVLLKADSDMTTKLNEAKEEYKYNESKIAEERAKIFAGITAKDLRSSWIISGYDFDGTNFTGDYTLTKTESLPFYGTVTLLNGADQDEHDYKAEYRVDGTQEFTLTEFIALINDYVYDGTATSKDGRTYTATKVNEDFEGRVKELMFAFSQDDAETALNSYNGYVIKPKPEGSEKEQYMPEFADAGRELLLAGQNTFKVVATDYGYHIMFYSRNMALANFNFATLESYLNANFKMSDGITSWEEELELMINDWDEYENTDNYLYVLHGNLASNIANTKLNNEQQDIYNRYINNKSCVKIYKDVYKDMLG